MNEPGLVPTDAAVTVTATAPIRHLCPFKDELDQGTVTIVWDCNGHTIELHSLAAYLDGFYAEKISHETLVDEIFYALYGLTPLIEIQSVTARFTTAGIGVEVHRDAVHVHTIQP